MIFKMKKLGYQPTYFIMTQWIRKGKNTSKINRKFDEVLIPGLKN